MQSDIYYNIIIKKYKDMCDSPVSHTHTRTHTRTHTHLPPLVHEKGNHMQPMFKSNESCSPPTTGSLSSKAPSLCGCAQLPRQLGPKPYIVHCKSKSPPPWTFVFCFGLRLHIYLPCGVFRRLFWHAYSSTTI